MKVFVIIISILFLISGCKTETVYLSDELNYENGFNRICMSDSFSCDLYIRKKVNFNRLDLYMIFNSKDSFNLNKLILKVQLDNGEVLDAEELCGSWIDNEFNLRGGWTNDTTDNSIVKLYPEKVDSLYNFTVCKMFTNISKIENLHLKYLVTIQLRNSTKLIQDSISLHPKLKTRIISFPKDFRGH